MSIDLHFADTETTGLIEDNPEAEIIEIAVIKWRDGDRTELLHERVRPKRAVPPEVARVNGYTPEAWKGVDAWDAGSSEHVIEMLKGALICGSNPDFDKRMIAAECYRTGSGRPQWSHRGVNTAGLGMMLWIMGETEGCGLGHLARYFNIEHAAHTALGDCHASIGVWEAFFDRFIFRPKVLREALTELEIAANGAHAKPGLLATKYILELTEQGLRGDT